MRGIFVAGLACVLLGPVAPAVAQSTDPFAGVWFFQSLNFSRLQEYTSTMAGTAIVQRDAPNHYSIHIVSNQLDARVSDGSSWATLADQRCQGVAQGAQLDITCEIISVANPQYGADSFAVQRTDDRTLTGTANERAQVVFTRVDSPPRGGPQIAPPCAGLV